MGSGLRNPENYYEWVFTENSVGDMITGYTKSVVNNINFIHKEKILDYGCGTGTFFKKYMFDIAIEKKIKLIGVDISNEMVQFANNNSYLNGVTEYFVGNVLNDSNWPLAHERFDRIFTNYVVQLIENYGELFQKFNQYLKTKGTFSAIIPTSKIFHMFTHLSEDPFWSAHYTGGGGKYCASWITKDASKGEFVDFRQAMVSAKFKIVEYHQYFYQIKFGDIFDCLDFFITVNGLLCTISKNSKLYEKLTEDLLRIVKNHLGMDVDQKPFHLDYYTYCFTGEKLD